MIKINLPLILTNKFRRVGFQATLHKDNIDELCSMDVHHLELGNLVTVEQIPYYKNIVTEANNAQFDCLGILYCDKYTDEETFDNLVYKATRTIQLPVWQVGQEVDLTGGMIGYFGNWGINSIGKYLDLLINAFTIAKSTVKEPKIMVGISGNSGWDIWLREFIALGGMEYCDILGFHNYTYYPYNLNIDKFTRDIRLAKMLVADKPVWLTEFGYIRGDMVSGSQWDSDYYAKQEQYIYSASDVAFANGLGRVYYYGWNPGWLTDLYKNPRGVDIMKNLVERYDNVPREISVE